MKKLKVRNKNSNKGDFGRVGIIAGSRGMTGSVYLSNMASLRMGAGLSFSIIPKSLEIIMGVKLTEVILQIIEDENKGIFLSKYSKEIIDTIEKLDAVAIGPGMGSSIENIEIVKSVILNSNIPIVIDADGLNALSNIKDILYSRKNDIVITPHPGEMSRLMGISIDYIQKNRVDMAVLFSRKYKVITVLKGSETVVCSEKAEVYVNKTGNVGMATAGSGDILTGMITSLIAQGMSSFESAKLGVFIHGLAGDLARDDKGEYGLIASDILHNIPYAIKKSYDIII